MAVLPSRLYLKYIPCRANCLFRETVVTTRNPVLDGKVVHRHPCRPQRQRHHRPSRRWQPQPPHLPLRRFKPTRTSRCSTLHHLVERKLILETDRWYYPGNSQWAAYWDEFRLQKEGSSPFAGGRSGRGRCRIPQVGEHV